MATHGQYHVNEIMTRLDGGGRNSVGEQAALLFCPSCQNVLGLSIEEKKDWRPLNGKELSPSNCTSIHSPQQQAHRQDSRGCVVSKSSSQVLTELGNLGLSWQEEWV
jgi:hypothetical protein